MDREPETGRPPGRPALPLAALALLALSVWVLGLWRGGGDPRPPHVATDGQSDELADELRRFRAETSTAKRVAAIQRFGKVRDPRVVVTLMEVMEEEYVVSQNKKEMTGLLLLTSSTLCEYHMPEEDRVGPAKYWAVARLWWEKNEAEVRRQAGALPQ